VKVKGDWWAGRLRSAPPRSHPPRNARSGPRLERRGRTASALKINICRVQNALRFSPNLWEMTHVLAKEIIEKPRPFREGVIRLCIYTICDCLYITTDSVAKFCDFVNFGGIPIAPKTTSANAASASP